MGALVDQGILSGLCAPEAQVAQEGQGGPQPRLVVLALASASQGWELDSMGWELGSMGWELGSLGGELGWELGSELKALEFEMDSRK